jgi:hypothetical protein
LRNPITNKNRNKDRKKEIDLPGGKQERKK